MTEADSMPVPARLAGAVLSPLTEPTVAETVGPTPMPSASTAP